MSQLNEIKAKVTQIYEKNRKSKVRYVINIGGARSSKTYSLAQLFIQKFFEEKDKMFLVTRKTMPALRLTAYKIILNLLKAYGLYTRVEHNKTANTIEYGTNMMVFISIDDPEKVKSTEWNYIWMEETNEFTWDDFMVLETRLSGKTTLDQPNQLFMSFNPSEEYCFVNQKMILDPKFFSKGHCQVIHSTYRDNPFLDKEYVRNLEELKEIDPNYWRIYGLGEWGILEDIIYAPYAMDGWREVFQDVYYGLDFGFNNPCALLKIGEYDGEIWLEEKIYESRLTNEDLIVKLEYAIPPSQRHDPIYADESEPARIEEIRRAGFNIHPADKSVSDGIDFVKRQKIHSCAENVNLNKERRSYKWRKDKNGIVLDEPVKFNDHLMDAKRYGIYSHQFSKSSEGGPRVTVIECEY